MKDNGPKIPLKHDVRAVCHLAANVLRYTERPVCDEVADTLQEACGDWLQRLEYLERKVKKYGELLNKIENESKEGLAPYMTDAEYESFYKDEY